MPPLTETERKLGTEEELNKIDAYLAGLYAEFAVIPNAKNKYMKTEADVKKFVASPDNPDYIQARSDIIEDFQKRFNAGHPHNKLDVTGQLSDDWRKAIESVSQKREVHTTDQAYQDKYNLDEYRAMNNYLASAYVDIGWKWGGIALKPGAHGHVDDIHSMDADARFKMTKSFQERWNKAHPKDQIAVTGFMNDDTRAAAAAMDETYRKIWQADAALHPGQAKPGKSTTPAPAKNTSPSPAPAPTTNAPGASVPANALPDADELAAVNRALGVPYSDTELKGLTADQQSGLVYKFKHRFMQQQQAIAYPPGSTQKTSDFIEEDGKLTWHTQITLAMTDPTYNAIYNAKAAKDASVKTVAASVYTLDNAMGETDPEKIKEGSRLIDMTNPDNVKRMQIVLAIDGQNAKFGSNSSFDGNNDALTQQDLTKWAQAKGYDKLGTQITYEKIGERYNEIIANNGGAEPDLRSQQAMTDFVNDVRNGKPIVPVLSAEDMKNKEALFAYFRDELNSDNVPVHSKEWEFAAKGYNSDHTKPLTAEQIRDDLAAYRAADQKAFQDGNPLEAYHVTQDEVVALKTANKNNPQQKKPSIN